MEKTQMQRKGNKADYFELSYEETPYVRSSQRQWPITGNPNDRLAPYIRFMHYLIQHPRLDEHAFHYLLLALTYVDWYAVSEKRPYPLCRNLEGACKLLGVSRPTALKTFERLEELGFIE
jgi:hypothetical protein